MRTSWKELGWWLSTSHESLDEVDMLEGNEKDKEVIRVSAQRPGQNAKTEIQSANHAREKLIAALSSLAYVG